MQRHEMIDAMTRPRASRAWPAPSTRRSPPACSASAPTMEILTDLLRAEAAHRHAASIRYRMTAAKLPVVKDLDAFVFDGTPINEGLVRSLHAGSFLAGQRNVVLVGGTGTGKTHLAIAITASVVRAGARGRYFNTVDLVNRLEEESPPRQGRRARGPALPPRPRGARRARLPAVRPLRRPAAVPPGQQALRAHLGDHHHQPRLRRVADRLRRRPR